MSVTIENWSMFLIAGMAVFFTVLWLLLRYGYIEALCKRYLDPICKQEEKTQ